jgi:hypothetical protein
MSIQSTDYNDVREAMIHVWNLVKPSEAKDLKIIVASDDGRFAGIYSCDLDQHGDRFFVLKEKPRSKTWTMASNLMSHLEDLAAAGLGRSARQSVNEFREIMANPSAKYEPAIDNPRPPVVRRPQPKPSISQPKESPNNRSIEWPRPTPSTQSATSAIKVPTPLRGKQLLQRVKELEGRRPEELARLCGYLMLENGQQTGDTESFYAALYEAHSS